MLTKPTPWLKIDKWEWYGNFYADFFIYEVFFHRSDGRSVNQGTYIETGGSNGVHASNTLFFDHFLDWRGMLIEPTPCGKCLLPHNRPRAATVNGAICTEETKIDITSMKEFCPPPQDSCTNWDMVRCAPSGVYSKESNITSVDFFSIDVEAFYMNVLKSWDWNVKPTVIFIECKADDCWNFLVSQGYTIVKAGELGIKGPQDDTVAWLNHHSCMK